MNKEHLIKQVFFGIIVLITIINFTSCEGESSVSKTSEGKVTFNTFQNANIVIGQPNMTSNTSNIGGAAAANTLHQPWGNPIVINGKLYICDYDNNRVLGYNRVPLTDSASADFVLGQSNLQSDSANQGGTISLRSMDGPCYAHTNGIQFVIADCRNSRVLLYNSIPTETNTPADIVVGQPDTASNSPGTALNRMNWPSAAFLLHDKLIVAECAGHRVLIFNTIPTANNTSADIVLGTGTAGLSATQFNWPCDVWSDGTKLIVADMENDRLLVWFTFPTASGQLPDTVLGQPDLNTNVNEINAIKYNGPSQIYVSPLGQFVVCDFYNNRFLIWNTLPESNNDSADVVLGQPDFTSNAPGATEKMLGGPSGVFLYQNKLITVEFNNNRTLIFEGTYY